MKLKQPGLPHEHNVEVRSVEHGEIRVTIDGEEITATIESSAANGSYVIRIGSKAARVLAGRQRNSILVAVGPAQFEFVPVEGRGRRAHGLATPEITAPMPGKVVKVLVAEGQAVEAGSALIVLEAMKMETALNAESAAVVKRICVAAGDMIDHGAVLLELSPAAPLPTDGSNARGR
ncbi:MAG TPA: biotin/lipoyl-containing protein [Candidatus Binataceae bacterium]|nr:biotin/lipoyl-containing protein [Candidatus Binataceae bacterium]